MTDAQLTEPRSGPSSTRGRSASPGARSPRGRRGAFATVTALLVVLVAAAAAVEAISLAMNRRLVVLDVTSVARYGRTTRLDNTVVLIVSVVAFAVGVVLLLAALIPPRRHLVELGEPDRSVAAGLTRRSLRRTLAAAALGVDGISSAKVSGRRRLKVRTTTSLRNTEALPELVHSRVTARVQELNPVRASTVRVSLKRKDD